MTSAADAVAAADGDSFEAAEGEVVLEAAADFAGAVGETAFEGAFDDTFEDAADVFEDDAAAVGETAAEATFEAARLRVAAGAMSSASG